MTNDELNRHLAELLGWTDIIVFHPLDEAAHWGYGVRGEGTLTIPDYCNDLNAVHEVENKLNLNQAIEYMDALWALVQDPHICRHHGWLYIMATARERTEALILTLEEE